MKRLYMITGILLCVALGIFITMKKTTIHVDILRSYEYYNSYDDAWVYPGTTGKSIFSVYRNGDMTFQNYRKHYYSETHRSLDDDVEFDDNTTLIVCHGLELTDLYYNTLTKSYYQYVGEDYYYIGRAEKAIGDDPRKAYI